MKITFLSSSSLRRGQVFLVVAGLLSANTATRLIGQTPCPEVNVLTTGLLGPNKIIQTPLGNLLISEVGTGVPNTGRISIVDPQGNRRTLLEGLPSAREFLGNVSGPSGLALQGRTLFVASAFGNSTLAGPVQGTEQANPAPASPLFSSVLAIDFPETLETNLSEFAITLADHHTLKAGSALSLTNAAGQTTRIRLVVDFVDSIPEPRPAFTDNVRHSTCYGLVADRTDLYVIDAGLNSIRKVDLATGVDQILVSFPPTPSPLTNGPPVMENVPTSIHWVGGQLVVTTFGGAPFLPGYSKVLQIDPRTGAVVTLVEGLTTALDAAPLLANTLSGGLLTLEHDLNFPQPGFGRLQSFPTPTGARLTNSTCLTTPASMLMDRGAGRLILSDLGAGRLLWLPAPLSLTQGETWTRKAPMPTRRFLLASCVLDGKIHALGGTTVGGGAGLPTHQAYDPATDSWTTRAAMPTPRGWFAAEAVNGKIYAIGGDSVAFLSAPLKSVEEYDPGTDTWTRKTDMPTAREGFASAQIDGKIYIIGGLTTRGAPALSTVEAYDPTSDSWERKAPMPTPRGMLCATVLDGKIFAIGAAGPGFPLLSTMEMYDPLTDTWTRKPSMPTARGAAAAVTAHGRIYVMGGRIPETIFALIQEYDPTANTWTRRTNIWTTNPRTSSPLFGFGAKEINGRIYTIGGASGTDEQGLAQVLEYIPPVLAPALWFEARPDARPSVLQLEWLGHSDYLDVLETRDQLDLGDWIEVDRFSGTGQLNTREIPQGKAAEFYRLRRALR